MKRPDLTPLVSAMLEARHRCIKAENAGLSPSPLDEWAWREAERLLQDEASTAGSAISVPIAKGICIEVLPTPRPA